MRVTASAALFLGVVAAALDFSSGYSLAIGNGDVAMVGDSLVFAACLLLLGAVALCTGVAAVLPQMATRSRKIGLAAEICGVAMAAISAWAPIMAPVTDFAMLAVGGLMVLNGAMMQRSVPKVPRV